MSEIEIQRKEFANKVMSDPHLLELLSTDRLKRLLEYYEQENEKKKEYLKRQ